MQTPNHLFLIFPHQLFEGIEPLRNKKVLLIEEPLFFTQYRFHIQKLAVNFYLRNQHTDIVPMLQILNFQLIKYTISTTQELIARIESRNLSMILELTTSALVIFMQLKLLFDLL